MHMKSLVKSVPCVKKSRKTNWTRSRSESHRKIRDRKRRSPVTHLDNVVVSSGQFCPVQSHEILDEQKTNTHDTIWDLTHILKTNNIRVNTSAYGKSLKTAVPVGKRRKKRKKKGKTQGSTVDHGQSHHRPRPSNVQNPHYEAVVTSLNGQTDTDRGESSTLSGITWEFLCGFNLSYLLAESISSISGNGSS
ncbi:uncharacterized protein LOC107265128 [Cephus cinctus]|uniref:Uncharacterized protein LOC107265128 n=1 Tax=Cephus cinctus TaxID=211228 RepID=A0AAJ7RCG1_CEPCN|nr:uncharacterized protein LOC107265128 [Cephus cinctus]